MLSIEVFNTILKPDNFEKFQQNLTVSKSATIYYFSSTMAYGIGLAPKIGKKNRNQLANTTDPSSAPSNPLYSYDKLNEYTDINCKKSFTA